MLCKLQWKHCILFNFNLVSRVLCLFLICAFVDWKRGRLLNKPNKHYLLSALIVKHLVIELRTDFYCLRTEFTHRQNRKTLRYLTRDASLEQVPVNHSRYCIYVSYLTQTTQIAWRYHCIRNVQIRSFFWSVFSSIRTEYGDWLRNSPYSSPNTGKYGFNLFILFNRLFTVD